MSRPWPLLESKARTDFRIFTIRTDLKKSPRTGAEHDFYVIDCPHWVNVIAITPGDELVMVEQYRHGTGTVELEVPGGILDPGDPSPIEGAARELREETGYEGDAGEIIGSVFPNPAIQSNTCYTALFLNCVLKHPPEFDQCEDITTRLVPVREIPSLLASGQIRHALVVAAFSHFHLWRDRSA